ncbi:ABC transporter family substrate-binding protein [Streptomyces sp. BR123]|uniref:ABC transporter family substrate-binding protein n=1 Tax=Streptomyces sp. BR123 TaxID=2749828 RepID=UPI0015C4D5E3|nr:ABC transporter family substrate-binding protein [Streptomyces sp. BR123]NXY95645.1 ABC transporter family substrate-binding protein [Streptomyces sp. BR123]
MSQRRRRSLASLLTSGVLVLPLLAGCGAGDEGGPAAAGPDIAATARDLIADGGVLRWAVDGLPETLNVFQADADATTTRIAGAVLPQLFTLDDKGRPTANPDFLEKAEIVEREPKQVVLYKLHQQAVWSDGREIGAADFLAQWRALNGKNSAYWTARNAGYERIEKIERGRNDLEVRVTFAKPYTDWRSLFSPLYPKQVTGTPDAFNEGARGTLKVTAGPFNLGAIDKNAGTAALTRNARWWGRPTKLDSLVLTAVPRAERAKALLADTVDLAEVDRATADRITQARRDATRSPGGAGAPPQGAATEESGALRAFTVRRSLEPAYTQLALNGASGPLADERVRRAVARAIDRRELAEIVLGPLGLPVKPVGSHLALAGQRAYADNSDALGGQDTKAAQALLADAGWRRNGVITEPAGAKAGPEAEKQDESPAEPQAGQQDDGRSPAGPGTGNDGLYIVGEEDERNGDVRAAALERGLPGLRPALGAQRGTSLPQAAEALARQQKEALLAQAAALTAGRTTTTADEAAADEAAAEDGKAPGADDTQAASDDAPAASPGAGASASPAPAPAQPARTSGNILAKDGKALSLRFVLPSGPGSDSLRTVGERIAKMLRKVGVATELTKVADESFFKDHIASGQYDLALYSWPASAYPATDARPIFAKPEPAADGSLLVEQNYTRVGTDHIDQLFDQAVAELDEEASRELMRKADARIWAAAGSIPLYQRPELVAVKQGVANAGAFGLGTPRFQDIGWKKAPQGRGSGSKEGKEKNK